MNHDGVSGTDVRVRPVNTFNSISNETSVKSSFPSKMNLGWPLEWNRWTLMTSLNQLTRHRAAQWVVAQWAVAQRAVIGTAVSRTLLRIHYSQNDSRMIQNQNPVDHNPAESGWIWLNPVDFDDFADAPKSCLMSLNPHPDLGISISSLLIQIWQYKSM